MTFSSGVDERDCSGSGTLTGLNSNTWLTTGFAELAVLLYPGTLILQDTAGATAACRVVAMQPLKKLFNAKDFVPGAIVMVGMLEDIPPKVSWVGE